MEKPNSIKTLQWIYLIFGIPLFFFGIYLIAGIIFIESGMWQSTLLIVNLASYITALHMFLYIILAYMLFRFIKISLKMAFIIVITLMVSHPFAPWSPLRIITSIPLQASLRDIFYLSGGGPPFYMIIFYLLEYIIFAYTLLEIRKSLKKILQHTRVRYKRLRHDK